MIAASVVRPAPLPARPRTSRLTTRGTPQSSNGSPASSQMPRSIIYRHFVTTVKTLPVSMPAHRAQSRAATTASGAFSSSLQITAVSTGRVVALCAMTTRGGQPFSPCTEQTHAVLVRSHVHGVVGSTHRLRTQASARCQAKQIGSRKVLHASSVRVALSVEVCDNSGHVRAAATAILGACRGLNFVLCSTRRRSTVASSRSGRITRRAEPWACAFFGRPLSNRRAR